MPKVTKSVKMIADKTCKSCIRYKAVNIDEGNKVAASIYLQNDAYNELGKPKEITVTVTA